VRFVRRHRAVIAVAGASAVVLAIVATLSVRRIVAERDDANAQRALAEARQRDATAAADRLLVQHAQVLADTDPVGAIALLRTLSPSSTRWREAWLAAVAAWSRGLPFGFVGEPAMLALQISADNHHLVTGSRVTGHLTVYDLVTRHAPGRGDRSRCHLHDVARPGSRRVRRWRPQARDRRRRGGHERARWTSKSTA